MGRESIIQSFESDAKECGFNVQSQLEACLKAYKSNPANAHIQKVAFIDFDGARCYIGKFLTAAICFCLPKTKVLRDISNMTQGGRRRW